MRHAVTIATDGSCIQPLGYRKGDDTPRPGAAGFVAQLEDGSRIQRAVPFANGLIGGMEVKGLLMGLEAARVLALQGSRGPVTIKSDSQYVVDGYNKGSPG